jgi:SPP1 gp7 family putative phage head morphogenesis protein
MASLNDLIKRILDMLDLGVDPAVVKLNIKREYDQGLANAEIEFDKNFVRDDERLEFLQQYTFDNIKGMNADIAESLRKEISQSILNHEGASALKERVMKVMDVSRERARMIARTELNRANNMGHLDGAKQSGLKLVKVWDAHLDARTSPLCRALNGKKVGINEQFVYDGKEYDSPPGHPNCRSTIIFEQIGGTVEKKWKYVRRTGGPGNYHYWYRNLQTGKLENKPQKPDTHKESQADETIDETKIRAPSAVWTSSLPDKEREKVETEIEEFLHEVNKAALKPINPEEGQKRWLSEQMRREANNPLWKNLSLDRTSAKYFKDDEAMDPTEGIFFIKTDYLIKKKGNLTGGLDKEAPIMQAMKKGDKLPTPQYWLTDDNLGEGNHRVMVAKKLGLESVPVRVYWKG